MRTAENAIDNMEVAPNNFGDHKAAAIEAGRPNHAKEDQH
jgi:hypothetical protein